jgi:membrane protein implicated in regulation of membrane protease activity
MKSRRVVWVLAISSALAAAGAAYLFLSAIATASLRFWYCGPTSLDHPEAACRIGTKLLLLSYVVGVLAAALAAAAIWLHWRRRKGSNNSSKPTPLRGAA